MPSADLVRFYGSLAQGIADGVSWPLRAVAIACAIGIAVFVIAMVWGLVYDRLCNRGGH